MGICIINLVGATMLLAATTASYAGVEIVISKSILENADLEPVVEEGPGPFDNTLAMNVHYGEVQKTRIAIEKETRQNLNYFKGWNPLGEAHVTVITPPEYFKILKSRISMDEIRQIALSSRIQQSRFQIEGIGSGSFYIDGKEEETYFFILKSPALTAIRKQIHDLFVLRGGNPKAWNPDHYFPHITIGFTKRDLHESDGVFKDAKHSLDTRFFIRFLDCLTTAAPVGNL